MSILLIKNSQNKITTMSIHSNKNSRANRSKRDLHERSGSFFNQKYWISQQPSSQPYTPIPQTTYDYHSKQNNEKDIKNDYKMPLEPRTNLPYEPVFSKSNHIGNKSPAQLMQDILRVVHDGEPNRVYYSKQTEQTLSQLLTNRFKLSSYIKKLQSDMVGLDSSVVKNYEVLVLLLNQLSGSDIEVRQGDQGMQLKFNRGLIQRQQAQIQRLQKEKEERQKQIKYIIEQYESIIFNFNDVIQKLVNKQQGRHKSKF